MYFSIAEQTIAIPGLPTLTFRVNRADSSIVELSIGAPGPDGQDGTHVVSFKRNGGQTSEEFVPTLTGEPVQQLGVRNPPFGQPGHNPNAPFASVNDGAVRATDPRMTPQHGVVNRAGTDERPRPDQGVNPTIPGNLANPANVTVNPVNPQNATEVERQRAAAADRQRRLDTPIV